MSDMRPITGVLQTSLERECPSYFRYLQTVSLIRFSRRFSLTARPDVVGQVFVVKSPEPNGPGPLSDFPTLVTPQAISAELETESMRAPSCLSCVHRSAHDIKHRMHASTILQ